MSGLRKLKHVEKKLLKKTNIYNWKRESNIREIEIIRRYHIQKREDYVKYNKICGEITALTTRLAKLGPEDPMRKEMTEQLVAKLLNMGVINNKSGLSSCTKITASAFCRRRIPVVMVRLKMASTLKEAITYIEQGQVRVGPEVVTDPAFLVTRNFEDFVTWTDNSKIREKVLRYNDQLDDYTLLGN